MHTFKTLLDLACGRPLPEADGGPARRLQLAMLAALGTVGFAAIYGACAGSSDLTLALGNVYKLPMVLLLSSLCALPGGLLAWKLVGTERPASDLVLASAIGTFSASLVLAVLGPVVALYYHTSTFLGAAIAITACGLALLAGFAIVVRTLHTHAGKVRSLRIGLPTVVLLGLHLACLVQFVALASPILPEVTVFDGGADALLGD